MADPDQLGTRQRKPLPSDAHVADLTSVSKTSEKGLKDSNHPAGPPKYGTPQEILRITLFALYFAFGCLMIHGTQLLGLPIYFYDRELFYSWMAFTKHHFTIFMASATQWWSPTVVRISGDSSMDGQLKKTEDGRIECDFPERLVLIANHQIYTDWIYLWWISYTAGMCGHLYIILKQSLKWVPLIGPAMQAWGFIFMSRKWASDQSRLAYRMRKLRQLRIAETGEKYLVPMWLLIFPEGTNLSANTRKSSVKWSQKASIPDSRHALLPRSTGLQFCLSELNGSVDYVYDCTIAYEHVPEGQYAQDIFTLRSVYFQGRPPKSVNMHWRRYKVSDIPVDDKTKMEDWVLQRWREKDDLLEAQKRTGKFPSDQAAITIMGGQKEENGGAPVYIETEVRLKSFAEIFEIFVPMLATYMVSSILIKLINFAQFGKFRYV